MEEEMDYNKKEKEKCGDIPFIYQNYTLKSEVTWESKHKFSYQSGSKSIICK